MRDWVTDAPTTYQGSDDLAFQRWFKFKEAFSPTLVRSIIDQSSNKPKHILDCCAGSGTTGIVAQLSGLNSTLVEVNPFLADLSSAKLSTYEGVEFHLELSRVLDRAATQTISIENVRMRLPPTFVEPGVNDRWLFSKGVAKEIENFRLSIKMCRKPDVRRFFRIALATCLIQLSNVRIDGKGRRYRQNWQARMFTPSDVKQAFIEAVTRMAQDVYRYSDRPNTKWNVINDDARSALNSLDVPVDLALFSPPYPNSFDYTDIYNIELWMLGYFKTFKDNAMLRRKTLRSHVQIRWASPNDTVKSEKLRATVRTLRTKANQLWNRRIPEMVQAYFEDLQMLMLGIQSCLSSNASIAMVVGDSSYGGVRVDTAAILEEIATTLGWQMECRESARVMRASIQHNGGGKALDEWLLIFRGKRP